MNSDHPDENLTNGSGPPGISDDGLKKTIPAARPAKGTPMEQARTRMEQANLRTDEANLRAEQATAQMAEANARTKQADLRAEKATAMSAGLRDSELSYRRLFESARDGILILDAVTGRITDVNPFLVELLGFSHDEMLGKTVGELSPFKDLLSNQVMLERLQKDGFIRYEDLPLETSQGRRIAVEFVSNVYQAGDKNVIQCNIRDITERKRTEGAMFASEARYRRLFEAAKDGILILNAVTGRIVDVNPFLTGLLGYARESFIGKHLWELGFFKDIAANEANFQELQAKEYIRYDDLPLETSAGRRIEVEFVSNTYVVDGHRVMQCNIRDITERKEQEREIARWSRLYAALSHINQAIVTLKNREDLFAKICRVLVEIGKLRMAWVGWLDSTTRQVIPVAQCGDISNYLSQVKIYADDRPEGQGPTGTALREQRNYICNDFNHDPRTLPWRQVAGQAGFRSSASFVIRQGAVICGAITVYAVELDYFQDKEIALLEEAATDISFALDNYVREEARRQAELELRWKTAFLEAQVDASPDGILVVDDQGKKLLQNQHMIALWKIPPEVAGNPDDRVQVKFVTNRTKHPRQFAEKVARLYSHRDEVSRDEIELVDGTFLDRYSAPVSDKAGKHYGRIWAFRDMTERKQTEAALLESKRFLRSTLDALSAHIAILDEQGTIIAVNAAWSRFASENHCLGSQCGAGANYLKVCGAASGKFSEDAARVERGIREVTAGQREMFTLEYPCHSPQEKRWFTLRVTRFGGAGPVRVVVAHENISERKRIEMRFRRLVDSNAQGVVFWNAQGQITQANDAFLNLVGYTRADLEAGPLDWPTMTPPQYTDLDQRALRELATTGICEPFEKEYIRKDGKRVPILLGAAAFEDAPDEGVCFVLDLTERKLLEQQFRQAQKMETIGTLAGGVAHDFNNILACIQMQTELLKSGSGLATEQMRLADDILVTVQRAVGLTRQLLLFSRKEVRQTRDLDLNHSVKEMTKMLTRILGENIQVTLKLAARPMFLHADAGMMDQVLMNLAVNGRDAMADGGRMIIETAGIEFDEFAATQTAGARPGSFVCLSVNDNGCGIPAENLSKIFEPFFTTKGIGKGTGLGLATVLAIAEQHQGWVNVYSEIGHGTTFRVYLPRLAEPHDTKISNPLPTTAQTGHETILLVEDEPTLRSMMAKSLTRLGHCVLEASTGFKALEVWKEHPSEIHLLLTDLMMPDGMTGKELGRRLLQANPKLKVIYMSGYSADFVAKDFPLQEGVNFLVKPFQVQQLAQTIRQSMDASGGGT